MQIHRRDREPGRVAPPLLSREFLAAGGMETIVAHDAPGTILLTHEQRRQSLSEALAARPAGDVRVFGYGSLIRNPGFRAAEKRIARVDGWHRAFCLSVTAVRGSPGRPGLRDGLRAQGIPDLEPERLADGVAAWRAPVECA